MKALIIYSTRGGVSRQCAEILSSRLMPAIDTDVFDINAAPPSPEKFDVIVIGGSIRMGTLNRKLKRYITEYMDILSKKQTAIFLCCGLTESFDDYVSVNIPKSLNASLGVFCFGGELKPDKLRGFDKLAVWAMRQSVKNEDFESHNTTRSPLPEMIPENIYILADKIRSLL